MATLEDVAEELVVRLKGLDTEIEESEHALEELRGRVEETSKEVEQEWSHLTEAAESFLEKVRAEQEQLASQVQETFQATADARSAVQENLALARSEIAEGQANQEGLSQRATGLEPGVESLIAEAGEAPAGTLAQRAQEIELELARVLEEARDFLQAEVVTALDELNEDVRERCREFRTSIAEEGAAALQEAFDDWESKVDELEAYVAERGFMASHRHARVVVAWALGECTAAGEANLAGLNELIEEAGQPLRQLASEVRQASTTLAAGGAGLPEHLDDAQQAAGKAVAALDGVKDLLASYSFVEA